MTDPIPLDHVLVHVHDRLARDDRVGELGLDVVAEGDTGVEIVVVRGSVSTDARKSGVVTVVREVLDAHDCSREVRDETEVPPAGAPPDDGGEAV